MAVQAAVSGQKFQNRARFWQDQPSAFLVPGILVAGELFGRQAVTAAGMGCAAAIDAERFLAAQRP